MAEENLEEKTSYENQEEETENSENQPSQEESDEKDVEKLEKDLQSAIAQKKSYRDKFEKLQDMLQEEDSEKEAPKQPKENASNEEIDSWREKVDFMLERQQEGENVAKEDVELIEKLRQPNQSIKDAYENNKDIIDFRREKRTAETKPQEPSGPASGEASEDFRKRLNDASTPEEEDKILKEEIESRKQKGTSGV